MGTVLDLANDLRSFDPVQAATESIKENSREYLNMNKDQMKKGEMPNGTLIKPRYSLDWYAHMKEQMNPLPGFKNPDLKLTGQFHLGMFMKVEGEDIIVGSSDSKADDLEKKYGSSSSIYGLNAENESTFTNDFVMPVFFRKLEQATGLKAG
jgi:hypothetical protein